MKEKSDSDILVEAIKRAKGFDWFSFGVNQLDYQFNEESIDDLIGYLEGFNIVPILLFNHSFAKALWGEESVCDKCGTPEKLEEYGGIYSCVTCGSGVKETFRTTQAYKFHLQQMVLFENPINYLRRFMEGKK